MYKRSLEQSAECDHNLREGEHTAYTYLAGSAYGRFIVHLNRLSIAVQINVPIRHARSPLPHRTLFGIQIEHPDRVTDLSEAEKIARFNGQPFDREPHLHLIFPRMTMHGPLRATLRHDAYPSSYLTRSVTRWLSLILGFPPPVQAVLGALDPHLAADRVRCVRSQRTNENYMALIADGTLSPKRRPIEYSRDLTYYRIWANHVRSRAKATGEHPTDILEAIHADPLNSLLHPSYGLSRRDPGTPNVQPARDVLDLTVHRETTFHQNPPMLGIKGRSITPFNKALSIRVRENFKNTCPHLRREWYPWF